MPMTPMVVGAEHLEAHAGRRFHPHGVAEAEGQFELVGALGRGPVADAHDVEVLAEPVGDADDHVVDQRAAQAVQGPVLPLVVGAFHHELVAVAADGDLAGQAALELALRALDRDVAAVDGHLDAAGTGMGDRPMRDMSVSPYQT